MEKVIPILVIVAVDRLIEGRAINSGFTLKLNPIFVKDDVAPLNPAPPVVNTPQVPISAPPTLKTTQAFPKDANYRWNFLSKAYIPQSTDLAPSSTKQIAKILFPSKLSEVNTTTEKFDHFINVPILPQAFPDYKIIVATAPWNMRFGGEESSPAVIYIVFPEDDTNSNTINIPTIYFVKKNNALADLNKKDKNDPVIIIDSNRVVTGIKSKEVAKYLKFKSKLNTRDTYEVSR